MKGASRATGPEPKTWVSHSNHKGSKKNAIHVKINDNCTQMKCLHTQNLKHQTSQSNIIGPTDKQNDRSALPLATPQSVAPQQTATNVSEKRATSIITEAAGCLWNVCTLTARQHGVNVSQTQENQSMTTRWTKLHKTGALRLFWLNSYG